MGYLYGHPQNAIRVYDSTPAMNIEDSRRLVTKQDAAEKAWVINNLSPEYWLSPYDNGPYLRDETALQFALWRMVGEKDQTGEYVEPVESLIYIVPTEGRPVFYNKGGLSMAEAGGIINFRDVGVYLSKAHDLMKRAEDFMTSSEGYELAIEHPDLLSKAPSIDWIVIGKIPNNPDAVYGVAQVSEDTALLFGNVDSYKMEADWAKRAGIDVDALIRRGMGEEVLHWIRRGEATVQEETDVREWLIDMYSTLAEKSLDANTKEQYMRMVRHLEKDLATVRERYSKAYSRNMGSLVKMYNSDSGKLELMLEAEAIVEEGLTTEAAVREYVTSRLEEIAEVAENEYSEKDRVAGEEVGVDMAEYEGDVAEAGDAEGEDGVEVCVAEADGGGEGE